MGLAHDLAVQMTPRLLTVLRAQRDAFVRSHPGFIKVAVLQRAWPIVEQEVTDVTEIFIEVAANYFASLTGAQIFDVVTHLEDHRQELIDRWTGPIRTILETKKTTIVFLAGNCWQRLAVRGAWPIVIQNVPGGIGEALDGLQEEIGKMSLAHFVELVQGIRAERWEAGRIGS